MEMSKERRNFVQTDIMAILLATLMVLLAEVTGEKEIIFPEIAALTVGYWVAPKRSWMVNGKRMLFLITISAVIGLLIVLYSNVPLYMAAFVIMILVLTIVHLMKMYMPPAGAVAILSLLIPQEAVAFFSLQILAGISIFMIASRLIFARLQNIQRQE